MIKSSLYCLAYYSSDLGGHIGDPTKEEYIKWIQFGTFEPIFRPHCTCSVKRFREPFNYDEETVNIFRNYTNLRYRLLPFIYKEAFETYQNGLPFIRALSLNYPNDKKANNNLNELFEQIYWKNPNIINHIEMNIKFLYYKNVKKFDKYIKTKQNDIKE